MYTIMNLLTLILRRGGNLYISPVLPPTLCKTAISHRCGGVHCVLTPFRIFPDFYYILCVFHLFYLSLKLFRYSNMLYFYTKRTLSKYKSKKQKLRDKNCPNLAFPCEKVIFTWKFSPLSTKGENSNQEWTKRTHMLNNILIIPKTSEQIFCELIKQMLNFLEDMSHYNWHKITLLFLKRASY